ncbi:MAG: CRTAC1 family protein [Planctomycetaceae bacterium]|nr:CRTAC1 family protein [Planctomycetaceae bacterium]
MNRAIPVIAILLILGIAVGVWFGLGFQKQLVPDNPPAQGVDLEQIAGLKNRLIAMIENQVPREAFPLLVELETLVPEEQNFQVRNQLVAIDVLLAAENAEANPAAFQEFFSQADSLSKSLDESSHSGFADWLLISRIEAARGEYGNSLLAIQRATQKENAPAAVWFELYERLNRHFPEQQQPAFDAIQKAHQQDPENVWVLLEMLGQLNEQNDPQLVEKLKTLSSQLEPFLPGIQQRSRVDLKQILAQTIKASEEQDQALVIRNLRLMTNVLRPEDIAQSDRARVTPNSLEFIATSFSPDRELAIHEQSQQEASTEIKLVSHSLISAEQQLSVRQVEVCDLDLDGIQEVLVLTETELQILKQQAGGWQKALSHPVSPGFSHLAIADLDLDADPARKGNTPDAPCALADLDLILWGKDGVSLLETQLGETIQFVPHPLAGITAVQQVFPGDFDLDGDLDLMLAEESGDLRLFANHMQFSFLEKTDRLAPPPAAKWLEGIAVDLDRDIDLDLLLIAEDQFGYLENLRHGELRWRSLNKDGAEQSPYSAVAVTDFNADARWDILFSQGDALHLLTGTSSTPGVAQFSGPVSTTCSSRSIYLWDDDNSGRDDVLLVSPETRTLDVGRMNNSGEISLDANLLPSDPVSPGILVEDVDLDGDLDVVNWSDNQVNWLENQGGNQNGFLRITLLGQQIKGEQVSASGRVNQYGWGSLLELKAGSHYQAKSAQRPFTHFGLGKHAHAEALRVVWPNGIPQNIIDPAPNSVLCEELKLKGSCPYLYTWDGEQFVFATDLLWAAPIGLQFAEGVLAPTRAWEYLLVDGDQLKPLANEYHLRVTEELWEAAYFDQIELIAIDHPESVQVYSNEKVGTATPPEFKVHVVKQPLPIQAAVDRKGRNVLPLVAALDDQYVKLYEQKFAQGVTEEHFLEIDLGEIDHTQNWNLVLTGWMYPSDTSMNVARGQNPQVQTGRPPFLQTLDEDGNWVTVDELMGFPGGKTKTIVVNLDGKFRSAQSRFRIVTSMEIYWDHVFYAKAEEVAGQASAEVITHVLPMTRAELKYRGFSQRIDHPGNGPDRYDYDHLISTSAWPPMSGEFTSYGDVLSLVNSEDDRLVVMGAGDEIDLRFSLPATELPSGWKRDFILHNVGYDKDADLNTVYGRSSEPFPTRSNPINPALDESTSGAMPSGIEAPRSQPARRFWREVIDYSAAAPNSD